jgi:hypothetical protein
VRASIAMRASFRYPSYMASEIDFTLKYKRSARGLDIIQAVYAFVMALGLKEVFVGSHTFITDILFGSGVKITEVGLISFMLMLNVVLLGMRFFWVPRNLRRIIYVASLFNKDSAELSKLPSWFVSWNWFVIFLHSGMYYIICTEFKYIMFLLSSNLVFDATVLTGYFLGHALLLIVNGLWIGLLAKCERTLMGKFDSGKALREVPGGTVWFRNNLIFSLLALAPLAIAGTCQNDMNACVDLQKQGLGGPTMLLPTSPVMVSALYVMASGALGATPVTMWVLICLLLNSLLDLGTTGHYYVVLEEVEWEGKAPEAAPPPAPAAQIAGGGASA